MKKTAFFIFVLIISVGILTSCGNSGDLTKSINGTVLYGDSDSRVVEAEIFLDGIKKAETDYYGQFFIVGLDKNNYEIIIEKDGKRYNQGLVQPTVSSDLTFRIGDISGSTTISGEVNIFNETGYEADQFQAASNYNFKAISNIDDNNENKYAEDEIIVKYDNSNNIESLSNSSKILGFTISNSIKTKRGNLIKIKISDDKTVEEMIEYFNQQPGVEFASANYKVYAQAIPNDEFYIDEQWGHLAANLEAAWDVEKYSNSTVVAVLDTGIIPDHPDLDSDNILNGANFVDGKLEGDPSDYNLVNNDVRDFNTSGSHGTHVAGIIGALTNNRKGIAGVSWGIKILPIKVLKSDKSGEIFDIIEGIYYSIDRNVDIINMSLGLIYDESSASDGLIKIMNELEESIEDAYREDIVLIAAAGNDGSGDFIRYPAAFEEVIAVGASVENILADYSNYNSDVDILAPGGDISKNLGILSTSGSYDIDNDSFSKEYINMDGTSMSAAYVSGTAALLLENGVSSSDIKSRLLNTASEYSRLYDNLDAYGALLGKQIESPFVFAARTSGNELIIESNSARTDVNNNYTLYDELEGEYYMVAWRDIDKDEEISAGDYFGITPNTENLILNNSYNIDVDMYYVTESSTATSLNIVNLERLYKN